ncbi:hypothetical protein DYGSA30_18300 [Dyella sp. GSA-30]|nr:hypothetical protein DYGSA30_18300 [Dyella sp. GSA-30]
MNKKILALTALIATAFESHAQVADLNVIGVFGDSGKCSVDVSNGGTYDLGTISSSLVRKNQTTPLQSQTATWTVACDILTYVTLTTADLESASSSELGDRNFGLGNVNSTGKLGSYTVTAKNPAVDGQDALFSTYTVAPQGSATALLRKGAHSTWMRLDNGNLPASGRQFKVDLEVNPRLATESEMAGLPPDGTPLKGHLTLTIKQGL